MLSISDFFSEEGRPARGVCTSLLAGILFAAGWWVLIDGKSDLNCREPMVSGL